MVCSIPAIKLSRSKKEACCYASELQILQSLKWTMRMSAVYNLNLSLLFDRRVVGVQFVACASGYPSPVRDNDMNSSLPN